MARAYRSGLVVKVAGLKPIYVDLYSVKQPEVTFHTVCNKGHDPVKVNRVYQCPECQSDTDFVKGREVDGTLVLVDSEAVKATNADEDVKQQMVVTAHPLEEVLQYTVPGSMVYYIAPSKAKAIKGFNQSELDEGYAILSLLVRANPGKALVTVFAPSTKPSMFRFAPVGDQITLSQLEWPENLREAPELPVVELDAVYGELAPNLPVQEFDPTLYRDDQKAAREELVAAAMRGEVTVTEAAPAAPTMSGPSALDAFKAALTAPAPKAPRKRAPKA
jgi:non-homologous end joining protein Ku